MTEEERESIRAASDIGEVIGRDVELRQRGGRLWGRCPFHEDRNPSLMVDPARGTFHCFGCQAHGDVFDYVMRTRHATFAEAAAMLAERAGIAIGGHGRGRRRLARARLSEAIAIAVKCAREALLASSRARSWLANYGIGDDAAMRWGIGLAPGGSTICHALREAGFDDWELRASGMCRNGSDTIYRAACLPVAGATGSAVGLVGQTLTGSHGTVTTRAPALRPTPVPAAPFAPGRPYVRDVLAGLDRARNAIAESGVAVVTAGPLEAVILQERGIANAVSCVGCGLGRRQADALVTAGAERITILLPDAGPGAGASFATLPTIMRTRALVACATLRCDDMLAHLAAVDDKELEREVSGAKELVSHVVDRVAARWDLSDPQQIIDGAYEACRTLAFATNGDRAAADLLSPVVAERFGVCDTSAMMGELLGESHAGSPVATSERPKAPLVRKVLRVSYAVERPMRLAREAAEAMGASQGGKRPPLPRAARLVHPHNPTDSHHELDGTHNLPKAKDTR